MSIQTCIQAQLEYMKMRPQYQTESAAMKAIKFIKRLIRWKIVPIN